MMLSGPPRIERRTPGLYALAPAEAGRWVVWGVALAGIGYAISFLGSLLLQDRFPANLTDLVAAACALPALALARRGRPAEGGALMALAIWLELHASVFLAGTLLPSALPVVPALVLGIGLLFGASASLWAAAATALSLPGAVVLAGAAGWGPGLAGDEVFTALILALSVAVTAVIVSFSLAVLTREVKRAQHSERRLAETLAHAPDGIVQLDRRGTIVAANPPAERMFGRAVGSGRGIHAYRLARRLVADVDRSQLRSLVRRVAAGTREPVELELRLAEGVRATLEVTSAPLLDPRGRFDGLLVMTRDVSARRLAERQAVELGRILEEARAEIYVVRIADGSLALVSRGARERIGRPAGTLAADIATVNPLLTPAAIAELGRRARAQAVRLDGIHVRADGSRYPVEVQAVAATLDGEDVVVLFAFDVSERTQARDEQKRLLAQLQHAQKMEAVGQLAGGIAHDFNNLLTVIGGSAEALLYEAEGEVRELALEIRDAQERGAALTRQLLAFARRGVVQPALLSLSEVAGEVRPLVRRLVGERIDLRVVTRGDAPVVADRGQIEQVILNLVANARDAMPDGGTVEIHVDGRVSADGFVSLEVVDSGEGMDPEVVRRACEPFFTTKRRGRGTGLGLSTVHGIVSQNGGSLEIDSDPGRGTTVRVLWPRASIEDARRGPHDAEAAGAGSASGEPGGAPLPAGAGPTDGASGDDPAAMGGRRLAARPPERPPRVLVAEDDDGTRGVVRLFLEGAGYETLLAGDGAEALALLEERGAEAVDLVVTDIVMPRMSGVELGRRIGEIAPDLPVLYMSGYLDPDHAADPDGTISWELIRKPFRRAEFLDRVGRALAMRARAAPSPKGG
ncbi:MAG: PAS domain-containing sensor histidine kinase [Gemmatimonadetes bacterium]|nr:MAG: PAS domain-containing sensor histidine kinase [Gemmatimonadota bacterium]